ncbi:MAG: hypothetical protein HYR66_07255 [Sphingobacteriales bacterium]|nr:hypothetical protein [Sphingobacteriales bacterium]MBI3718175.1 hypothetical protein [Sphingobacteriales bacterium]
MSRVLIITGCLISFICLNLFCLNNNKASSFNENDTSYKVYKIDSINNFYLIYASKKGIRYKIVSQKRSCESDNKIQKDGYYGFELSSMLYDLDDIKIAVGAPGGCVYVDSITKICIEDSIPDLKLAKNIKGLCFEKKE